MLPTIVLFCFQDATTYQAEKEVVPNLKPWSVKDCQSYRSPHVQWLTLENEKKTAVSQDWQNK